MGQKKDLAKQFRWLWIWCPLILRAVPSLLFWSILVIFILQESKNFNTLWSALLLIFVFKLFWMAMFLHHFFESKPELVQKLFSKNEQERLNAFAQLVNTGEKAIPLFVQALKTPPFVPLSSTEFLLMGNYLSAHSLAVEGLGLLKAKEAVEILCQALKHPYPNVRAKAAWALGEIGDPSSIPHIIPLLGEDTEIYPLFKPQGSNSQPLVTVSDYAAYALQKLGESELVVAFKNALKGKLDENSKQQLKGKYRPQVVQAFVEALDGNALTAIGAAWAIGELSLFEALPALEEKVRSPFVPSEVRKTCREAIGKLRSFAYLPAIPSFSPETTNLPRPANAIEIDTSNLPRPANFDKDAATRR
ncbi:MAG: HEAT repeat domain-containing protein [Armatimonadota bacterium]|nr:HEAT repeat domain-containing protein [Armatimonadota bacterium]MDW8142597.1 HEAT repeat domain-containing protein [Armatimonadota bacterium]